MKNDNLEFVEFNSSIEFSGMLNELLAAMPYQFCVTDDLEKMTTSYRIYYGSKTEAEELMIVLLKNLSEWSSFGIECSKPRFSSIKNEDWTEVWKRYFKVLNITPTMVIKPSWIDYKPSKIEKVIEIDPEMSFGTGGHETTQFCLKAIEKLSSVSDKSFLDAGCGSGILSIAAALCGYSPIFAFDNDRESMETTTKNFSRNGIHKQITFSVSDISAYEPGRQFGVVVANIISGVLVMNNAKLKKWVKQGGFLVIAGILKHDYGEVKKSFEDESFSEIYSDTEKEWTGGVYQKR